MDLVFDMRVRVCVCVGGGCIQACGRNKDHLEDLDIDGRMILNVSSINRIGRLGLDWSGLG